MRFPVEARRIVIASGRAIDPAVLPVEPGGFQGSAAGTRMGFLQQAPYFRPATSRGGPIVKRSARAALGIAALFIAGPACALEVTRSRDIPAPPAAVWALIGDFCAIGLWHPQVERCILSREDDDDGIRAQIRGLVAKGGLGTIVEVETARDEAAMSYSYSFVQGPLPVRAYNATLAIRPNGTGSTVVWTATFDAEGMSDAEALKDITGVYDMGLAGIAREVAK